MRIAILSTFYPFRGGIAQFNAALYQELEKHHTVKAFTFKRQYPSLLFPGKSQLVDKTDDIDTIQADRLLDTLNPYTYYKTAKAIRKFKPDLLIFKYWLSFFAPAFGSVAYLVKKDCKIISILDNVVPHEKRPGDKALTNFFINQNDGFIAMSKSVLNDLNQFTDNKNKLFIPHPIYNIFGEKVSKVDAINHLKLNTNDKHILFFGFIRRYKGLDLLLEAMSDERIRGMGIKLIIAGECYEDWNYYQDIINKYNIGLNVILKTDYIPSEEIKYYFCAADMVVQPYRSATQSGVTQIAYQFERPMLVTDVGGLAETVPHNKVGYIVERDSKAIAEAIINFYEQNKEDEFSANAAIEKKNFSWDTLVNGIVNLYKGLNQFSCNMLRGLLLPFLLIFSLWASATNINGKVTDENNKPLPFVAVYLKGTSTGTTTNSEGFFSFNISPGDYILEFRYISYKMYSENISVKNETIMINAQLFSEAIQSKEVVVYANAEDLAYAIIRKAQKKRKHYLHEVHSYSCDAYTKMVQRITEYPKKLFGQTVDLADILDTTTKIVYLSESVSKLSFMQPHKIKEEMISSKVSGSSRAFSFNAAQSLLFNFYENLLEIGLISKRGFVSPISATAMLYYNYHYEGSFNENGETVNKIKVIPKRKSDPVFSGYLYIIDVSWRIHSVDLMLTKKSQLEFVDTLKFHEVYLPVKKDVWLPFNSSFTFVFGFLGFKGNGTFLGINSNYTIDPDLPKGYFDNEVFKIDKGANKKDSSYWKTERPVPLTSQENRDYVKRDSTTLIHESKGYMDSVDRKKNKFSFSSIYSGYAYSNSYEHRHYSFSSPLGGIQFNTAEGFNLSLNLKYEMLPGDDDLKTFSLSPEFRYGFSNHHFNEKLVLHKLYNPLKHASYTISGGSDVVQFNNNAPISEFINSLYSLLAKENYMKIYEKRFINIHHSVEVINGFILNTEAEYADRLPLVNTTSLSWDNMSNRAYTSNDPANPSTDQFHFQRNETLTFSANAIIHFDQAYVTSPNGKFNLRSKYPTLIFNYRKGFKDIAGSAVDYDFASTGIRQEVGFGLFGRLRYVISYGGFINKNEVPFMDEKQFNGNQTFISSFEFNKFNLLPYYTYTTTDPYLEAHAEHNFQGFFLNKIPLIRKLKLSEVVSVHYLHTSILDKYIEGAVGIEKLNLIRIDFATAFSDGKRVKTGFLLGLKWAF